jgi:hypothetical protein
MVKARQEVRLWRAGVSGAPQYTQQTVRKGRDASPVRLTDGVLEISETVPPYQP